MQNRGAATLIELLVVLAAIALLAGIFLPALNKAEGRAAAGSTPGPPGSASHLSHLPVHHAVVPHLRDPG